MIPPTRLYKTDGFLHQAARSGGTGRAAAWLGAPRIIDPSRWIPYRGKPVRRSWPPIPFDPEDEWGDEAVPDKEEDGDPAEPASSG